MHIFVTFLLMINIAFYSCFREKVNNNIYIDIYHSVLFFQNRNDINHLIN